MLRVILIPVLVLGILLTPPPSFAGVQVPQLASIPERLDGHHREELANRRSALEAQWTVLLAKANEHNKKCGKVPANTPLANECRQQESLLLKEIAAHIEAVKRFNGMVEGLVEMMEAVSRRFDWQKLKDGTYLGTGIGEEVAQWYADNYAATGSWLYGAGGLLASLWTPDTYLETLAALAAAEIAGSYFGRLGATQATEATATRGLSVAERSRVPTPALRVSPKPPNPPKWLLKQNPRSIYYEGDEIVGYMDAGGQFHITTGEGYASAFNRAMQRAMDAGLFSPGGEYYLPLR